MRIIFDTSKPFLQSNPHYQVVFPTPLPDYYMWSIAYLEHPDSPFSQFTHQEKLKAVESMFEQVSPIASTPEFSSYREEFSKVCISKKGRFLRNWEAKLEERDNFMLSVPYNEETYEMMDKLMGNSDKLWKQYRIALKEAEEEAASTTQGDQAESLDEQGII